MKYLIVSIHDAAPPYLDELKALSAWLDQQSIRPRSIKVIPDYLGQWNILEHRKFLDWVLSEKNKGSEIIQHGYKHKADAHKKGYRDRLRDKCITKNEAEFSKSGYEESRKRIEKGKQIMEEADLICSGFTSPTWYQSKDAGQAIQDCGFRYYTTVSSVFDCQKHQNTPSLAMGYLGTNPVLEHLASLGQHVIRKTGLFCSPYARMVLHPGVVSENGPLRWALKEIHKFSQNRDLITYQSLLDHTGHENR
jgi:predicted deacetylase